MRKGKSIIGLKVISQDDGTTLGTVRDLIFDQESDELLALLLSERDLFGLIDAQVVPYSQVTGIGPDAIVVDSSASKINAGDDPRVRAIMDRHSALSGTRVFTTDGQDLGTLADMYVDEESGRIEGYELSGGFVSDTMTGKNFLPASEDIKIGKDVALVPPEVADELEARRQEEPGGLQAHAAVVGDKISDVYGTAKDKAQDTYANVANASVDKQKEYCVGKTAGRDVIIPADRATLSTPSGVPTIADSTSSVALPPPGTTVATPAATSADYPLLNAPAVGDYTSEVSTFSSPGEPALVPTHGTRNEPNLDLPTASEAMGTTSSPSPSELALLSGGLAASLGASDTALDSSTVNGEVLVRKGETITRQHADRAADAGVLHQLVLAASQSTAGDATATSQQHAAVGLDTVKEHAAGIWETVKERVSELTGAAHDKKTEYDTQAEQNKINNALGRPVTRVILDRSDNVVLNTGDLITNAAIESARTAGVLDVLLDSVYTADPEITPEMMRAREPGQAALETQAQPSGGPITATVAPDQPAQDTPSQGTTF